MLLKISGKILEEGSGRPLAGLTVHAMDADFLFDDQLGEAVSGEDGAFSMQVEDQAAKDRPGDRADVYLVVKSAAGNTLKSTRDDTRFDCEGEVHIDVAVPRDALSDTGETGTDDGGSEEKRDRFASWTWRPGFDASNPVVKTLTEDLAKSSSVLELMKKYLEQLNRDPSPSGPCFQKLEKLFDLGRTPESLDGHFYGVPIGIKSGDLGAPLHSYGNFLGWLWGKTLADQCPWAGKSFSLAEGKEKSVKTIRGFDPEGPFSLGINHFCKMDLKVLSKISFGFLTWWLDLDLASETARSLFGHERESGFFVSHKARSVFPGADREVLRLNYRFKDLENRPPLRWLVDEVVEIARGFYLGQLLFATRRLQYDFDPELDEKNHQYAHFGYFVLFDDAWNSEARRLFPHLQIPVLAPGVFAAKRDVDTSAPKFSTFALEDPVPPGADDELFAHVKKDLKKQKTILHLLKFYSDNLQGDFDNESPYFRRLGEIFHRGVGFGEIDGFYRGALVTWRSHAFLKFFDFNVINAAWMKVGRFFSTWTGKCFEPVDKKKLAYYTDGREKGEVPTFWGANTQALRTPKEIFTGKLMKAANVWSERVPAKEARENGYDLKNFFYVARRAESINDNHKGKKIFQLNYRWPKLETLPPDCYCIDELVRIADGLYMGQLMYSTQPFRKYDPDENPEAYKYRNFGYFLLMDDEWTRIRLDIGFDLENF